jgi:hypothetical protein
MRRTIPVLIVSGIGFLLLASYFFNFAIGPTDLDGISSLITNWGVIVAAFAVGLASVNLIRIHSAKVSRRRADWIHSLALLLTMAVFIIVGVYSKHNPDSAGAKALFQNLFDYSYSPFGSAMFAILAFYVASASYRAFRARSFEASLLLVAAVLVMLGNAPIGALIWNKFPVIGNWLLTVINMTGQRGITIGVAIGGFATSMRVLLGFDRGHLGIGD